MPPKIDPGETQSQKNDDHSMADLDIQNVPYSDKVSKGSKKRTYGQFGGQPVILNDITRGKKFKAK